MSDFNELLEQIHKAVKEENEKKDIPVSEPVIPEESEKSFVAPADKPVSQFRKNGGEYISVLNNEAEGFESISSFADRYAVAGEKKNDDAVSVFRAGKKTEGNGTEREKAVLDMAIESSGKSSFFVGTPEEHTTKIVDSDNKPFGDFGEHASQEELGRAVTEEEEEKPAEVAAAEEDDGNTKAFSEVGTEENTTEVKIADKTAILQQLATADVGAIDEDEMRRIDDEIKKTKKVKRTELTGEEGETKNSKEDEGEKAKKKKVDLREVFSSENVKKFKLRFAHLDTSFSPIKSEEYTNPAQRQDISKALSKARKSVFARLIALSALCVALIVINIVATASAGANAGVFTVFSGSNFIYSLVCLCFMLAGAGLMFDELRRGVYSILKLHPTSASILVCAYLAGLVQCICGMLTKTPLEGEVHILSVVVMALGIPVLLAKEFYYLNLNRIFVISANPVDRGCIGEIKDEKITGDMLRTDFSNRKPVHIPTITNFIENIIATNADAESSSELSGKFCFAAPVVALFIGIIVSIVAKSPLVGASAMTAAACIIYPAGNLLYSACILKNANEDNIREELFIASVGAAKTATEADNLVVSDTDLFTANVASSLVVPGVSPRQAEFVGSILAANAGGLLADAFAPYIEIFKDKFPFVEEFTIENRLGVSGWVMGNRVLMGNRTFMENHSVYIPYELLDNTFSDNLSKMYMSMNENFVACFALDYRKKDGDSAVLRTLVGHGTNLIIRASDPNLTDDVIEKMLSFPTDSVRVMSSSSFTGLEDAEKKIEPGFIFRPGFAGFIRAAGLASEIAEGNKFSKACALVSALCGLLLAIIAGIGSLDQFLSFYSIIFAQLIFIACTFVIPIVRKNKNDKTTNTTDVIRPVKTQVIEPSENAAAPAYDARPDRTPTKKAPVYTAVNETPNPEEASVTDATRQEVYNYGAQNGYYDGKIPELTPVSFEESLAYLDRKPEPQQAVKSKSIFSKVSDGIKSVNLGKVKGVAGKLRDMTGSGNPAPSQNDFNDYSADYEAPFSRRQKDNNYYNTGRTDTPDYDFVNRYSGDNMFSGLKDDE